MRLTQFKLHNRKALLCNLFLMGNGQILKHDHYIPYVKGIS